MIPEQRPYLTPEEGFRVHYNPEARGLLIGGRLDKWNDTLLMLISIYMVHRFQGTIQFHNFCFREDDGTRIVVSVKFTSESAQITEVVEERSIGVA